MDWAVDFSDEVTGWVLSLPEDDRQQIFGCIKLLRQFGPHLGRPKADTLVVDKKSKVKNLKELIIPYGTKQYRVIFAFDSRRKAILLVGGDKVSEGVKIFYEKYIPIAINMFLEHEQKLSDEEKKAQKAKPRKKGRQ